MWRGVAWRGFVWRGVAWRGVAWCGVVWWGVAWRGVMWCGVVWCGVVWSGVVWCGSSSCTSPAPGWQLLHIAESSPAPEWHLLTSPRQLPFPYLLYTNYTLTSARSTSTITTISPATTTTTTTTTQGAVALVSKDDYAELRRAITELPSLGISYQPPDAATMAAALADSMGVQIQSFQLQLEAAREEIRRETVHTTVQTVAQESRSGKSLPPIRLTTATLRDPGA